MFPVEGQFKKTVEIREGIISAIAFHRETPFPSTKELVLYLPLVMIMIMVFKEFTLVACRRAIVTQKHLNLRNRSIIYNCFFCFFANNYILNYEWNLENKIKFCFMCFISFYFLFKYATFIFKYHLFFFIHLTIFRKLIKNLQKTNNKNKTTKTLDRKLFLKTCEIHQIKVWFFFFFLNIFCYISG